MRESSLVKVCLQVAPMRQECYVPMQMGANNERELSCEGMSVGSSYEARMLRAIAATLLCALAFTCALIGV